MPWAYVQVQKYGERVTVRCTDCGTVEPHILIRDAQQACRRHNRIQHQRDVINPSGRHRDDNQ